MEYLWYILAAVGAGVGTGLAGLSAATVMVPILIVLCPSFHGETGAFQATAIALASDIFGSAVTTLTYARHKNIDLGRGWIMLVCILGMCTVGSYAAWLAGNVVLGSFTLFLTFCIGIRFLVRPDTSRKDAAACRERLDARGVAISLFFGLTIGFGTGFVGTGGGMMMLVVFTAFLGMELKTAVGTSTFIMTFTALIASVSHILIHPAIVFERWNVLVLCMTVATLASLYSARFANRVSGRTVGLVTGAVLTVLGAAMLLLYFREALFSLPILAGVLRCLGRFLLFIVPCVASLLLVRRCVPMPRYVFRKLLHLVAFSCTSYMILVAESWGTAALSAVAIALAVYPILALLEKETWYAALFVQKSPGEIKKSLLLLFFMIAGLVTVGWGIFGCRGVTVASVLMWGVGDAAAALLGIPYGRHKVRLRSSGGKKSWEGTAAMAGAAFLVGSAALFGGEGLPIGRAILAALPGALIGAAAELLSPSEYDTVTVAPAILLLLLLLT